jgi:penicillin-binding protein 2
MACAQRGLKVMRKRLAATFLAFLMVFGATIIGTDVQAYYKSKSKAASKKTNKSSSRLRAGVRRRGGSNKYVAGRVAARRRASARLRAAVARARAVDQRLLNTAQNLIQDDDTSWEDSEMRQAAVQALAGRPGTVVLMDPNTGQVYSIVNQRWALGKPFKPCSTIKLITSIAALSEKLVDPDLHMEVGGGEDINMIDALARSNNEYFQELGEQLGFEQVISYAREWGLGELTGINLNGESPGYLPGHKDVLAVPRMCSHGDDIGITALQLAVLTSAIANGGYIYQPQVLRTEEERLNFKPILVRKIDFSEKDRQKIVEGMIGAVSYGTARRSAVATINVAGKTGSCNGADSKLGLFASFTSPENPELVAVVISTGSSQRGSLSAMVSGEIYSQLAHRLNKGVRPRRVNPTVLETTVEQSSTVETEKK